MTSAITNPVELRSRGFQALVKELGWVSAVPFLREYEAGSSDYVQEREVILPAWDADTLALVRVSANSVSNRTGSCFPLVARCHLEEATFGGVAPGGDDAPAQNVRGGAASVQRRYG